MTVTPKTFKIKFPEFKTTFEYVIQFFIDEAITILNESAWGVKYDLGILYYAAHNLRISKDSEEGNYNSTGSVASRSVDGSSISFNGFTPTSQQDMFLSSTIYGQHYLALRDSLGVFAYVI